MKTTKIFADRNLIVGKVEPTLYGSFIEHLGRAVYEGIYEPAHPTADSDGFRGDVISLVRELGVPVVRYPGGNFVSGYDWRDGVGPREKRPARLDLAWHTTDPNLFGTDEFMKWCRAAGVSPMMAVNLGTGTVSEAAHIVEYCNHAGGSALSDYRRANGAEEPYGVKYWCLGNEMDGDWQIGHLGAEEYGKKAREAAKVMRWTNGETGLESPDKRLKLIVSGSSNPEMPSYPEWDRIVLEHTYDRVDYLSMHRYYEYDAGRSRPLEDFCGSADDMHRFIGTLRATIEYVRARLRSRKQVYLSFDEWNIWTQAAPRKEPLWKRAPHLLEEVYTFRDALVFAGLMNTLINNCDIVRLGCLAQLVNVIAPIITETGGRTFRQTTFYPFKYLSNNARGETIRTFSGSDTFDCMFGKARSVNEAVNFDAGTRTLTVSLCNFAQEARAAELELRSFGDLKPLECAVMSSSDLDARNGFGSEKVAPQQQDLPAVKDGSLVRLTLPPMSWTYLKLGC